MHTSSHEIILTGITTTGTPHLGNYVGAIGPAIQAGRKVENSTFYFLADFHALIKIQDPERVHRSALEVAATWLALGLDTERSVFYRQSDIPEITELTWILSCVTAKGLLNRAHAYKAATAANEQAGNNDPDKGVTMGLFCYPVLMAADILMFRADKVPVGKDQIQHIEMARDIAQRFNHLYGETFVLPEAVVDENTAVLSGLDGRKMSKSYDNTIPLFLESKKLRKVIMKITTDSLPPEAPKDPDQSTVFEIYKALSEPAQAEAMRRRYLDGISWGEAKQELFELLDSRLEEPRRRYRELMNDPGHVEEILRQGAKRAREISRPMLEKVRRAAGIRPLI